VTVRSAYYLGSDDVLLVRVTDVPDIGSQPVRIDPAGDIRLPMVGTVRAAGMTLEKLEAELKSRLKVYIQEPDLSVSVTEFHSQPVSVVGAVRQSGVHQLQGPRTLVELLSLAGGPAPEAGPIVRVSRRREWGAIPLPEATPDPTGEFSTVDINLRALLSASTPDKNIMVRPHDLVTVPAAELVFVIGEVGRPGSVPIGGRPVSALEAVASSGGVLRTGKPANARILREASGGARTEIEVDLKKIMDGEKQDVAMQSGDILVIPNNPGRAAFIRALEMGAQVGVAAVTWGVIR
jgi:polysaccharide export outer membrane protein